MRTFYFPESLYVEAHSDYLNKTGKNAMEVQEYCLRDLEFFVEVVFSYLDGVPYPVMKEEI